MTSGNNQTVKINMGKMESCDMKLNDQEKSEVTWKK